MESGLKRLVTQNQTARESQRASEMTLYYQRELDSPVRSRAVITVLLVFAMGARLAAGAEAEPIRMSVDASRTVGNIKRVNDVDNGPLCQRGIVDLTPYYAALGVRNVRLHDVAWTYDNVLDINYVFPHWDADPNDTRNYDFTQTDFYLKSISALDINIIYRLGYSAEYKTSVRHSEPPASYDKWSEIATHIVRHYNDAWANGQRLGIKYWEIWNEPDGHSLVFWNASPEEFYRFYENASRALKRLDPTLKVGGPAIAGSLDFLEGMLKYCHEHGVPLDFVSWHIYTSDPHEVARRARRVHELMVRYGFGNAESVLDEWNYGPSDWTKLFKDPDATRTYFDDSQNAFGAAFDETVMSELQDAPIDIATFFSGTTFMWGLFTSSGAPQKAYYAFLAFQYLLDSPQRLAIEREVSPDVSSVAGISKDRRTVRVLLSNAGLKQTILDLNVKDLPWKGAATYEKQVIDAEHNLTTVEAGKLQGSTLALREVIGGPSVCLLTIRAAGE